MRIGIVCSAGGHLIEAFACLDAFRKSDLFLVTYDSPTLANFNDPRMKSIHFIRYFGDSYARMLASLFIALFTFLKIFIKERPDVIFSTGSEIAIPAFLIGKLFFRTKHIYLESLTRVITVSGAGKIVYPMVDVFLVQSEQLLKQLGDKALYKGSLL